VCVCVCVWLIGKRRRLRRALRIHMRVNWTILQKHNYIFISFALEYRKNWSKSTIIAPRGRCYLALPWHRLPTHERRRVTDIWMYMHAAALHTQDTHRQLCTHCNVRGWKKIVHANKEISERKRKREREREEEKKERERTQRVQGNATQVHTCM